MRIGIDIHTVGARHTGNETYMRNLLDGMAEIAVPDMDFVYYHTTPGTHAAAGRWSGRLQRVWPHNPLVRIPLSFPAVFARDRIAVAHFQYVKPPLCPCPAVVTIHDISYETHPEYFPPRERAHMKLLIPRSARTAAHVLTVSEHSKREMMERYRVPAEKITVTYNGVSAAFRPISDEETLSAVCARYGLRRPFILGVGNLQPRKNLERLLEAYAHARTEHGLEHQLVLVGQLRWRGEAVYRTIARLGLEDAVKTTGYVDESDLVALYNLADFFVYPSLYEGFGLPIVEAMACGAPVITSNVTSMPEVAGDAALTIDPRDVDDIAHAIGRLAQDRELHALLRERGLARSRRYTWRAAARQTLDVYRQVCDRPARH